MGRRTEFEIRRGDGGFFVYTRFRAWDEGSAPRGTVGGGLAQRFPFKTIKAAKAWVEEQFDVPPTAWCKRAGSPHVAGKGDPLPRAKAKRRIKSV